MKRMALAGVLVAVVLAGCGNDESAGAPTQSTPSTSESRPAEQTPSVATAVEPASPTPAPPVESEAAPTPAGVVPTVPDIGVPSASDRPSGEQLYVETCQEFVTAIDALAATGVTSREQAAAGIAGQLQANPSWSTVPPEDQQQMLRGLDAAGRGSC